MVDAAHPHHGGLHPHAVAMLGAALWELAKLAWDYIRLIQHSGGAYYYCTAY